MSRIVLLRHAHSTANLKNVLAGRTEGISLSTKGEKQAIELAEKIGDMRFDAVVVSPIQRCSQTLEPWLQTYGKGISPVIDEGFSEVDYGTWTGKSLAVLQRNKLWKTVQNHPSQMVFPQGESLLEMQSRAVASFHRVESLKGKRPRLIVSHGDVIKSIVAHVLGMHLDQFQRLVIEPASMTVIETHDGQSRLISFNDQKSMMGQAKGSGSFAVGGSTGNNV
jgi:probable phosphomutase (TIGR03848 family)